jgi:hypothetical protein
MTQWKEDKPQRFQMDLDRGVITAVSHAGEVSCYVDEPGTYYDGAGNIVSDQVARIAGFDVDADRLKRRKLERLEKARAEINALWEQEKEAITLEQEPMAEPAAAHSPSAHLTDDGWRKLNDT